MSRTDEYRQQHAELIRLSGLLTSRLAPDTLDGDPGAVHGALRDLAVSLRKHLDCEDAELYPGLLRDPDPGIRELARSFQQEMGRIHGDFEAFLARWPTWEALVGDPFGFAVEALSMLDVLHRRIHLEDLVLYPKLDGAQPEGA